MVSGCKLVFKYFTSQTEITQLKEDRDQAIAAAAASATATAAATAPSSDSDSSSSSSESVAAIAAITSSTQAIEAKLAVLTAQHDNVIRSLDALDGKVEDERVKLPAIEDAMRVSIIYLDSNRKCNLSGKAKENPFISFH